MNKKVRQKMMNKIMMNNNMIRSAIRTEYECHTRTVHIAYYFRASLSQTTTG